MIKSIKSYLILSFSSLGVISLAIALFGFAKIDTLGQTADMLSTQCAQLIINVKNVEIQALRLKNHEKDFVRNASNSTAREQSRNRFNQTMLALTNNLDSIEALASAIDTVSPQQHKQIATIRASFEDYNQSFQKLSNQQSTEGDIESLESQYLTELNANGAAVTRALEQTQIGFSFLRDTIDGINAETKRTKFIFVAMAMTGLAVAIMALIYSLKTVERPVERLVNLARKVAGGDLNAKDDGHMPSEMMAIHTALEQMIHELKHRIGSAEGVLDNLPMPFLMVDVDECVTRSNQSCMDMLELDGPVHAQYGLKLGQVFYNDPTRQTAVGKSIHNGERFVNLEVQIAGHKGGFVDVLANVFPLHDLDGECIGGFCIYLDMTKNKQQERQIVEQNKSITQTAEQAGHISEQTATASEELSAQIEQTSIGTAQQRQRTQEAATAMEQMSASVIEIARNSVASAESAREACTKADNGQSIMDDTLASMTHLREQSDELKASLGALGQHAQGIGSVMDVISDIADQTNLLALNAAIEAARAGDAGRGFAVVADEVRKLAEKTTSATQEVGNAVNLIQQETTNNIQTMDETLTSIDESSKLAQQAGGVLHEIVEIVGTSAEQMQSIATASEEQSAAVEEISQAVESINGISGETANAMSQASQAVTDLSQLAQELHTIIDELRH